LLKIKGVKKTAFLPNVNSETNYGFFCFVKKDSNAKNKRSKKYKLHFIKKEKSSVIFL